MSAPARRHACGAPRSGSPPAVSLRFAKLLGALAAAASGSAASEPCVPTILFVTEAPLARSAEEAALAASRALQGQDTVQTPTATLWELRRGAFQLTSRASAVASDTEEVAVAWSPARTELLVAGAAGLTWLGAADATRTPVPIPDDAYELQPGALARAEDGRLWFALRSIGKGSARDRLLLGPVPRRPSAQAAMTARLDWHPPLETPRFGGITLAAGSRGLVLGITEYPARGPSRLRLSRVELPSAPAATDAAPSVRLTALPSLPRAMAPGSLQLLAVQSAPDGALVALVGLEAPVGSWPRLAYRVARWDAGGAVRWLGDALGSFTSGVDAASLLSTPGGELFVALALPAGRKAALQVWHWSDRAGRWRRADAALASLADSRRFHNDPRLWTYDGRLFLSWIAETEEQGYSSTDAAFRSVHSGGRLEAGALRPTRGRAVRVAHFDGELWRAVPTPPPDESLGVLLPFHHAVATCDATRAE